MSVDPRARMIVIGAGPAALSLVLRVALSRPAWLDAVRVFDDGGGWLRRFRQRLHAAGCEHLRSPLPHHPHPDPLAMEEFLLARGEWLSRSGLCLFTRVEQFSRFIDATLRDHDLERLVDPRRVVELHGAPRHCRVMLEDGTELSAERVVLAHNPRRPRLPDCAREALEAGAAHTGTLDVTQLGDLQGSRVLVVGAGHTAATLAIHAVERGARVTLLAHRALRLQAFDFRPGWLSARSLSRFVRAADEARVDLALLARGGGSVPGSMAQLLSVAAASGRLRFGAGMATAFRRTRASLALDTDTHETHEADHLWFATGSEIDADDPLLASLMREAPCPSHRGYPLLGADLTWPGSSVHLSGPLALSRVGPTAGTLHGHRWAAQLIAAAAFALA